MPHYSEEDIKKINGIDIRQVLEKLNVEYNPKTKRYRCPTMHVDRHPSMSVKNNCWHCFGCGASGNVIQLVMMEYNISFLEACKWIINSFSLSITVNNSSGIKKYKPIKKVLSSQPKILEKNVGDEEILQFIISKAVLSPEAKSFLYNERKFSPEVIEQLKIFSISNENKFVKLLINNFSYERLVKSNIINNSYNSIWKPPCILFPFYDYEGRLINIVSRRIDHPEKRDKFRSIAGVNTIPYNLPILKKMKYGDTLYIMEGMTDTLAALSNNYYAIGLHGCSNRLVDYREELMKFKLIYYHDNDDPGRTSFTNRQKELRNYFIPLEEGVIDSQYNDFSEYYSATKKD